MDFDNFEVTATGPLTIKNAHTGEVLWIGAGKIEQPTTSSVVIDEYDALMRKLYLKLHRKLWNWIADETLRTHKCVDKLDAFKHLGWRPSINAQCWACQYIRWRRRYRSCEVDCENQCLVDWGVSECTGKNICCVFNEPFGQSAFELWDSCVRDNNWKMAAQAARIIANLPERK